MIDTLAVYGHSVTTNRQVNEFSIHHTNAEMKHNNQARIGPYDSWQLYTDSETHQIIKYKYYSFISDLRTRFLEIKYNLGQLFQLIHIYIFIAGNLNFVV